MSIAIKFLSLWVSGGSALRPKIIALQVFIWLLAVVFTFRGVLFLLNEPHDAAVIGAALIILLSFLLYPSLLFKIIKRRK
jgi:hypothetical protein